MGFEWDAAERAAFDAALLAHLRAAFPDAVFDWQPGDRQIDLIFPDGARAILWEPNFFFSFPSFTQEHLFSQATAAIERQRTTAGPLP